MVGLFPGSGYRLDIGSIPSLVCTDVVGEKGSPCIMGVGGNVARCSLRNTGFMDRSNIVRLPVVIPADDLRLSARQPTSTGE